MPAGKHLLTITLLLISPYIFSQEKSMNLDEITVKAAKEINCKEYIHNLEPWKDGKLATMDGWGRFSTFEITEENQIKITPLVEFPKEKIDGWIKTYPEVGVIWSSIFELKHHFADIGTKKNVSFMPFFTKVYESTSPLLLDKKHKIFLLPYIATGVYETRYTYVVYDLQNDTLLFHPMQPEKNENFYKSPVIYSFENGKLLVRMRDKNNKYLNEYCMYDYYSDRTYKNKFTQFYSSLRYPMIMKVSNENIFIVSGVLKNDRPNSFGAGGTQRETMKNIFVAAILLFALGGAFAQTKKSHFELRGKNTLQRTISKCANLYYFGKGAGKTKLWTEKSQ